MKDVLLDFLVPRFKSDQQIEFMRSNLYANKSYFELGKGDNTLGSYQGEMVCLQKESCD